VKVTLPPEPLAAAGAALLAELTESPLPPLARRLALEACRIVDRLDRLDGLLRGAEDEWFRLDLPEGSQLMTVAVNGAMVEARQQANTLRSLASEIRAATPTGSDEDEGDALDQIASARASRQSGAADSR
jgi:hypothetical protein